MMKNQEYKKYSNNNKNIFQGCFAVHLEHSRNNSIVYDSHKKEIYFYNRKRIYLYNRKEINFYNRKKKYFVDCKDMKCW